MLIECIAPTGDRCGEGVVWNADEAAVYWTDINRFLIHRLDTVGGAVHTWLFHEPVVALALTNRPGTLLVALGSRLLLWRPETDTRLEHGFALPGWPQVRLNDGRADPLGNFWVGSMHNNVLPNGEPGDTGYGEPGDTGPGEGALFRIAPDGAVTVWREKLGIANTLCWSPDRTRFYFGDTLENEVRVYDYDAATGDIANERPFLRTAGAGFPDGSAIDAEGWLWNCRWAGRCILRASPDGQVVERVTMPVTNVTTAAFGGPALRTLYVSTAHQPGERLSGSLFKLEVDVPGLPENRFRL